VANNGTGRITIYQLGEFADAQVIDIPPSGGATPTGIVLNDTADFKITKGSVTNPPRYLVATEDGTIAGWADSLDPDNAIVVVDNSSAKSVYKGLALGSNEGGNILLATDFHNNKVDVFDANFTPLPSFTDSTLPQGFAPFGIAVIDGKLYVTFAQQDSDAHDDVPGPGNGYVDIFDMNGNLSTRFASQGSLNSPWQVVKAPDDFGGFSNAILIGNFGDGHIGGFDATDGSVLGRLKNKRKEVITIDGLWGFGFAIHEHGGHDTLLFASGLDDEAHGLIGRLRPREN